MTLFDCERGRSGYIVSVAADEELHRRLVDMGLPGARFYVRAKRGRSMLVDFDDSFSAVIENALAQKLEVTESRENRSVR